MDKINLLEALAERQRDVQAYKSLIADAKQKLELAEKQIQQINQELTDALVTSRSKYTEGELAGVRRGILSALTDHLMHPREIAAMIPGHPEELIMRELHKLANHPGSDVRWNGERGPNSQYARIRR